MNKKNFIIFKRNKRAILCEFLIPIILVGSLSAIVVNIPNAETIAADHMLVNNGAFVEPNFESVSNLNTVTLSQQSVFDGESIAVVRDNSDPSNNAFQELNARGINTSSWDSVSAVKDYVRGFDDIYDSDINSIISYEQPDNDNSKLKMSLVSRNFYGGFSPFDRDATSNVYSMFDYIGSRAYMASHAAILLESRLNATAATNKNIKINAGYTQRSSYEHRISDLPTVMDQILPIFVVITYSLPYMYILQRAVEEKQSKTRESMRMMGMIDSAYWTSWFIVYFFQILIVSIIMTLGSAFTCFPGSNPFLVFLLFF